jgi:hypothetical protein
MRRAFLRLALRTVTCLVCSCGVTSLSAADRLDPFFDIKAGAAAAEIRAISKSEICSAAYSKVRRGGDLDRENQVQLMLYALLIDPKVTLSDAECLSLYWRARMFMVLLKVPADRQVLQKGLLAIDHKHLISPWDRLLVELNTVPSKSQEKKSEVRKGPPLADLQRIVADALEREVTAEMQAAQPNSPATTPMPAKSVLNPIPSKTAPVGPIRVRNDASNAAGQPQIGPSNASTDCPDDLLREFLEKAIEKNIARVLSPDEKKFVAVKWCDGRSILEISRDLLARELAGSLGRELLPAEQQFAWNRWGTQFGKRYWLESAPELPSSENRAVSVKQLVTELNK